MIAYVLPIGFIVDAAVEMGAIIMVNSISIFIDEMAICSGEDLKS